MARKLVVAVCCAFVLPVVAQVMAPKSNTDKPVVLSGQSTGSSTWQVLPKPTPVAKTESRITKDGHYVFTLDDPNNEWRCYLTSMMEKKFDVGAATITCVNTKYFPVTDERVQAKDPSHDPS